MPRRHFVKKHIPYEHKAPCNRKRAFKTEEDALEAVEQAESSKNIKLKIYQCPYCAKWHLSTNAARQ